MLKNFVTLPIACLLLNIFVLFGIRSTASAELCTPDRVPGATLLIPYFEVTVGKNCSKGRLDTKFSITNVRAAPLTVNVVIWSEWSVPVLEFIMPMDQYDVDTFRLSDIVCRGVVTDEDIGESESFDNDVIEHARAILSGRQSPFTNQCGSELRSGNVARGYITIDVVDTQAGSFPSNPTKGSSYMSGLSFENALVGDVYYLDSKVSGASRICGRGNRKCKRRFQNAVLSERGKPGVHAVSIEAGTTTDFPVGSRTFYGRYNAASASDRREPLPSTYHVRFPYTKKRQRFDLIVWREGNDSFNTVQCDSEPNWRPMSMTQLVVFDTKSNATELKQDDSPLGTLSFDDETGVLSKALSGIDYEAGWLYFNFNTTFTEGGVFNPYASAYVMVRRDGRIDTSGVHVFGKAGSCLTD